MKDLFLIRHAKSSWDDDSLSDHARPLNPRGEEQLPPLARALQRYDALAGEVYASHAVRAQQTLQGIVPEALMRERIHTDAELYTFDYQRLLRWLQNQDDQVQTLAIVGHNPALLELAAHLVKQAPFELPTAGFIHVRLPIRHWRKLAKQEGRLEVFLTPRDFSFEAFERKIGKRVAISGKQPAKDIPARLMRLTERLAQLERGVMLGLDDEFLHQYRIALRRSRAIADSVAEVTKSKSLKNHLSQLKRHAQATSSLRDLHVFLQDLPALCRDDAAFRAELEGWTKVRAAKEQTRLAKRLGSKRYRNSLHSWENELQSRHFGKLIDKLSNKDIRNCVDRQLRGFNRKAEALQSDAPDEDLHQLRKHLKRLRYLMELDAENWKSALKVLRQRQDLYGRFQDLHVQIGLVKDFAAKAPEGVPSGADSLLDRLEREKLDARQLILLADGLKAR
ncbi:CHAD domain-containing protein [Marinobacter halophilus]|uniref:Histidine phosphatase n=1 Tax=Marinobacter halophilus TaxID=1323740 RepID=A0A2T1KK44_9GAMM|nr:CHAD domain-containing protein [Marinobacter halophilus]PSF10455.1 histidine phosphatase [Marinobacter halophilus]